MNKYFASKDTAERYAKEHGCKVDKCILLHEDGTPILDMGEHIEVYKVVIDDTGIENFGIGLKLQEA